MRAAPVDRIERVAAADRRMTALETEAAKGRHHSFIIDPTDILRAVPLIRVGPNGAAGDIGDDYGRQGQQRGHAPRKASANLAP